MSKAATIPELLGPTAVARLLGVSRSQFFRFDKEELVPAPVLVGRSRMWRYHELVAWVNAGAPPRWRWKWEPSVVVSVAELHKLRLQQLEQINREIADLEARIARGEKQVRVNTR